MSMILPVIDFRRQSMILEWHTSTGTWSAYPDPPALVHGVALIRAAQPNICVYGRDGQLHLQIGKDRCTLSQEAARLKFNRNTMSFGLQRRFSVESSAGSKIVSHYYWNRQGDEFFRWLTTRAADPKWRAASGLAWSAGVDAAALRSS